MMMMIHMMMMSYEYDRMHINDTLSKKRWRVFRLITSR